MSPCFTVSPCCPQAATNPLFVNTVTDFFFREEKSHRRRRMRSTFHMMCLHKMNHLQFTASAPPCHVQPVYSCPVRRTQVITSLKLHIVVNLLSPSNILWSSPHSPTRLSNMSSVISSQFTQTCAAMCT